MIKGWSFAKIITLPIPDAALTDFPVCVKIVADTDIGGGCLASGYDIRFTAADSITLLPYERESFAVASGEATGIFWVKSDVATAGTYLWLYYGNSAAADGADPENVWDTDFKAVYHMNDATTSTILDSTANDNDGAKKAANEPIEATGNIGKAQDSSADHITIPTSASIDSLATGHKWTMEAWLFPDSLNYTDFFGFDQAGPRIGYLARTTGAGVELYFQDAGGTVRGNTSTASLVLSEWNFLAITYDTDTNEVTFNINGVQETVAQTYEADNSGIDFRFGVYSWNPFNGKFDETRLSSIARSADWIAYEYANMNPADGGLTWGAEKNVKSAIHMLFEG
jgi:hypothetical protein